MPFGTATLGGTAIPFPKSWDRTRVPKGRRLDLANGGVAFDSVAYKHVWNVRWEWLTATQRNLLYNAWAFAGTQTFVDWEGGAATVNLRLHDIQDEPVIISTGDIRHHVTLTIEEV